MTLPSSWVAIDPTNPGPPDLMARWTAARPNIGQQLGQLASIWPIRSGAYGDTAFVAVDTNTFVMTSLAAVAPPGDVAGPAVAKAALQARFAYLAINEDAPASVFEEFQAPAGSAVQAYIPEGGPGGGAVYDMVVLPGGLELLLQAAISSSDWTPTEASTYRSVVSAIRVVGTPTGRPAFIDKALMARLPSRIGTDQVFVVGGSIVAIAEANPDQARLLSLVYAQLAATGLQPATFSGAYLDGPANAIVETVKVDGLSASRRDRAIAALKTSGFTVSTAVPGAIERPVPGTTPAATEYLLARGDLFVDVITPEPARAAAILAALP